MSVAQIARWVNIRELCLPTTTVSVSYESLCVPSAAVTTTKDKFFPLKTTPKLFFFIPAIIKLAFKIQFLLITADYFPAAMLAHLSLL